MRTEGQHFPLLRRVLLLLSLFFCIALAAEKFPSLYQGLGTPLFQAANGYGQLLENGHFGTSKSAMSDFVKRAELLEQEGFRLDAGSSQDSRKTYLASLRELAKTAKGIDRDVLQVIRFLKAQKLYPELKRLSDNPYPVISKTAMMHLPSADETKKEQPAADYRDRVSLENSLEKLRSALESAREQNGEEVACLNDVTAINYLMLKAEQFKEEKAWCKAYESCRQITGFERSARLNCQEMEALYLEWQGASAPYRTDMQELFKEACRR